MFKIDEWRRIGDKAEKALVFMMHGYGADMDDLAPLANFLGEGVVTYSVNAPGVLPSPEGTIEGRSWFNLISSPFGMDYDMEDVHDSARALKEVIQEKTKEEQATKVYLLGFSQGACLVHYLLLREPQIFAGGMALSGRFVDEVFEGDFDWDSIRQKPLFMSHGEMDYVIPFESNQKILEFYKKNEREFTFCDFMGGHDIPPKVVKSFKKWFEEQA